MEIYKKIRVTLSGEGDYDQIKKEWDLWGPLVISLVSASFAAFGTSGSTEEVFTNVFLCIWLGPLAIALNAKLLGAKVYLLYNSEQFFKPYVSSYTAQPLSWCWHLSYSFLTSSSTGSS